MSYYAKRTGYQNEWARYGIFKQEDGPAFLVGFCDIDQLTPDAALDVENGRKVSLNEHQANRCFFSPDEAKEVMDLRRGVVA